MFELGTSRLQVEVIALVPSCSFIFRNGPTNYIYKTMEILIAFLEKPFHFLMVHNDLLKGWNMIEQ
jgi:hypothetical protein